ncbi:DUF1838 family protein [Erythrobacter sp. HA6-11]
MLKKTAASLIALTALALSPLSPTLVAQENVSSREAAPETLRLWVDARGGTGEPVHWVSEGGIYEYPSGKKLAGMIGFDSSRVIWPAESDGKVMHLTRKTYAYTDPESGEVLNEFNGQPVEPIAYPYQLITYRYENGRIYGDVEQGTGDNVRQIKSEDGMMVRELGADTLAVTAPVFLDFPLPGGARYEAWENYDFFLHRGDVAEPHQMSWQRYGERPPFLGEGKAIYHLLSWRVESHDEFPETLLAWAKAEKPAWLAPPKDLNEIRELQKEADWNGWAR